MVQEIAEAKSVKSSLRSIYGVGKPLKVLFQGFPIPYMEHSELDTFCYCLQSILQSPAVVMVWG